jgi:IPT/TIG domain
MATVARPPVLAVLGIALAVAALSCGTCPPVPSITSISPASATAGGSQFLLTVNGNDFRHDSVVSWNGSFRVTTFVSSHELVVTITTTDIAQPETVLVSVFNPPEGNITSVSGAIGMTSTTTCSGKTSNTVSFTVGP